MKDQDKGDEPKVQIATVEMVLLAKFDALQEAFKLMDTKLEEILNIAKSA